MKKLLLFPLFFLMVSSLYAQIVFQKHFFDSAYNLFYGINAEKIIQTNDGGYLILAVSRDTNNFGWQKKATTLIKTNSLGDTVWTKVFRTYLDLHATDVIQTFDGGYAFCASDWEGISGTGAFILVKLNTSGDTIWTKRYGGYVTGKASNPKSLIQTSDGGYAMAGLTNLYGAGGYDVYVVKTNSSGAPIWARTYGGTSTDVAMEIKQESSGKFIVAGTTFSFTSDGNPDFYLLKLNSNGTLIWSSTFGTNRGEYLDGFDITPNGDYIMIGTVLVSPFLNVSDTYAVKVYQAGNIAFDRTYADTIVNDFGLDIVATNDGGYAITGGVSDTSQFGFHPYILKTDLWGNYLWGKMYYQNPNAFEEFSSTTISETSDNGFILGCSKSSWLIKTDFAGNTSCNQFPYSIVQDNPTTLVNYTPATQLGVGLAWGNYSLTIGAGAYPTTLCSSSGETEQENKIEINIFPNPFSTTATIQINNPQNEEYTFVLYDVFGREAKRITISGNTAEIERDNLPAGIYLYRLLSGQNAPTTGKIIIE